MASPWRWSSRRILLHVVMTERWRWPAPLALGVTAVFLTIDISFFGANLLKLPQGGWVSLFIALLLFTAMTTWKTGRRLVAERLTGARVPARGFHCGDRRPRRRRACRAPRCS